MVDRDRSGDGLEGEPVACPQPRPVPPTPGSSHRRAIPVRWTGREDRQLAAMIAHGVSIAECGRALDRTKGQIRGRKQTTGLTKKRVAGQVASRRVAVRELHAAGLTVAQMSARLDCPGRGRAQLHRDHKALGLTPHTLREVNPAAWAALLERARARARVWRTVRPKERP